MTATKSAMTAATSREREQRNRFSERVGSTLYRVNVFFPDAETETLETKILRLVKNDLNSGPKRGRMGTLQTGWLPDGGSL